MERLIVWHRWCPPAESSPEAVAQAALWRIGARARFVREGAEVIAELSGTVVFALDPADTVRAVELCLSLSDEIDGDGPESGGVSYALAISPLERVAQATYVGEAIDRAQALANRARSGEIVLDEGAQNAMATTFLFARNLSAGPNMQGEVIDRAHPRRRDCRAALAHLASPQLPPSAQGQVTALKRVAEARGSHRVKLSGQYGSGTSSWLRHVAEEVQPPLWLDIRSLSTTLGPLSGLSAALRRLPAGEAPEALLDPSDELDRGALATLSDVRRGNAVSRRDAIVALRHLLLRCNERNGRRAWITVGPVPLVDPASITVVAEATRDGTESLVVLRLTPEARVPDLLLKGANVAEVRAPSLTQSEGRALAHSMLGKLAGNDIARRAAAMGGGTPLGVAEAVRVLIASGDVIFDGGKFCWRRGPGGRVTTLTVEALLEARIDDMGRDARRLLEALATVPDPDEAALVRAVAEADGLDENAQEDAIEELVAQALVERTPRGLSISRAVRTVIEQAMPPARLSELSRFVANALERYIPGPDSFACGTLAYFVARAGRPREAGDMLLEVAMTAGQAGFVRSGVKLAAAAVECDPSEEIRARAAGIAEKLSERVQLPRRTRAESEARTSVIEVVEQAHKPAAASRPLAAQALTQAIEGILARDFDAVDRALELVVAAGKDGPSVDRLRGLALLLSGDWAGAQRLLDKARKRDAESGKTALAMALVLVETGQSGRAVREALKALAKARAQADEVGERASLRALSLCYRRLGREAEAAQLDGAVPRALAATRAVR